MEQFKNTTLLEQLKNLEKQKIPHEQALVNVGRGAMCLKTVVENIGVDKCHNSRQQSIQPPSERRGGRQVSHTCAIY